MKGKLFENGTEKGDVPDFKVTPGKNIYENVMGEQVLVSRTNATATFTSPIGAFHPARSYEVRCGDKVYPIKVTNQTNSNCKAIIENTEEEGGTSLPESPPKLNLICKKETCRRTLKDIDVFKGWDDRKTKAALAGCGGDKQKLKAQQEAVVEKNTRCPDCGSEVSRF